MKKAKIVGLVMIGVMCSVMFSGCSIINMYKPQENGYFMTQERKDEIYIAELSELGKQQEVIIIPEKINGKKVSSIVKANPFGEDGGLFSKKLKRMYLPFNLYVHDSTFKSGVLNLEKVFLIENSEDNGKPPFYSDKDGNPYYWYYYSRYKYEKYFAGTTRVRQIKPANISYMHNYADAPNAGYHWIDDVGYGEKIELKPAEPVRKGHIFAGWYKEAACLNRWEHGTDTTPAGIVDNAGKEIYQETILYAKWIKL